MLINNSHLQSLDKLMIYLTQFGREIFWALVIFLLFMFGKKTGRKAAIILFLSILVLIPTGTMIKEVIQRPRPVIPESNFLLPMTHGYSFPSGHALIVSACATIALVLLRSTIINFIIGSALTIEAGLVCYSRVYVGGHFPLDILGGILLGVGTSFLIVSQEKRVEDRYLRTIKIIGKSNTKG
jgi:membrane-associated phospholipid phosphatase